MRAIWRRLKIRVLGVGLLIQDFGEKKYDWSKKQQIPPMTISTKKILGMSE
jgi:hypothetical protein